MRAAWRAAVGLAATLALAVGDEGGNGTDGGDEQMMGGDQGGSATDGGGDEQMIGGDEGMLDENVLVEVNSMNMCNGHEIAWDSCPDLDPCPGEEPLAAIDCEFAPWNDWQEPGNCAGVCQRHRDIEKVNNKEGTPCNGAKIELMKCPDPKCTVKPVDCLLADWGIWSKCASPTDQKYRSREVTQSPENGGRPCDAKVKETLPCSEAEQAMDCKMSPWHDWTRCSEECEGGYKTRHRRVVGKSMDGGATCKGSLHEKTECAEDDRTARLQVDKTTLGNTSLSMVRAKICGVDQDCKMADWGEWSGCNADREELQMKRTRAIIDYQSGKGEGCRGDVVETIGCSSKVGLDCVISEWTDWVCDKTCGGGQKKRSRSVTTPALYGGVCADQGLAETEPCGETPCQLHRADCLVAPWKEWGACSLPCGWGIHKRHRNISSLASPNGQGCNTRLEEVKGCQLSVCAHKDCLWADWSKWSACSCSCGGGSKRRSRTVAQEPDSTGKKCEAEDMSGVEPCNVQACGLTCVDGAWGAWSAWSVCSENCGTGYRSKTRYVTTEANGCGKPAIGNGEEFEKCTGLPACIPDQDCVLSTWGGWSSCSCTCYGIQERHRSIQKFHTGAGKACDDQSLKELQPCNPGAGALEGPPGCDKPKPVDCVMGPWKMWSNCSAACGGGQRTKRRAILTPSSYGGKSCEDSTASLEGCNSQICQGCVPEDCLWASWSVWGGCTKCGGQRWRNRHVEKLPNKCGKICDPGSAKQVTECKSECAKLLFCTWAEWAPFSGCSAACGLATRKRQRSLTLVTVEPSDPKPLFSGPTNMTCSGTQIDVEMCPDLKACAPDCVPTDCVFGAWSPWGEPLCNGLCERHRVVSKINNECGQPCNGPLVVTKKCHPKCRDPVQCVLAAWTAWSPTDDECLTLESNAQRYRTRPIAQQPSNGGTPCNAPLEETKTCAVPAAPPVDCALTEWGNWLDCSKSCGGGFQVRSRAIGSFGSGGGTLCKDDLKGLRACNTTACERVGVVDCALGAWEDWSCCKANTAQQYRSRKVEMHAVDGGNACKGDLGESQPCMKKVVDCMMSPWTAWDSCDSTCGGGQKQRHRQVEKYPKNGGTICEEELLQTKGCNTNECPGVIDCVIGNWGAWTSCSATCGASMQTRERTVSQRRKPNGDGCKETLKELKACGASPPCKRVDCEWGLWAEWSSCTCTCGGGERTRDRNIATSPVNFGAACKPADKEEVQPCNTQSCNMDLKTDGEWADWEAWEPCSKTCNEGITWRNRKVAVSASAGGLPAQGLSREVRRCNVGLSCTTDVDCTFGEWGQWSGCSVSCDGVKRRSRRIAVEGRGDGVWCKGALKEVTPCNPAIGNEVTEEQFSSQEITSFPHSQDVPKGCPRDHPPQDCKLEAWTEWTPCSASCGNGQITRTRSTLTDAKWGGQPCDERLQETSGCNLAVCPGPPPPVDCTWAEWSEWSDCDKCDGQKKRFRHITGEPLYEGKPCAADQSEETAECPRSCKTRYFCEWGEWGVYGKCTATCGSGVQSRSRRLEGVPAPRLEQLFGISGAKLNEEAMEDKFQELSRRTETANAQRFQELAIAFAGGMLSLVALLAVGRGAHNIYSRRASSASQYENIDMILE